MWEILHLISSTWKNITRDYISHSFKRGWFLTSVPSKLSAFDHIQNNDFTEVDSEDFDRNFIEYAECGTDVLTCETKALLIAELMEPSSDERDYEEECAVIESMSFFNKSQGILQKPRLLFFQGHEDQEKKSWEQF